METLWFNQDIEKLCRVCLEELPNDSQEWIDFNNFLNGYENVSYSDAFTKVTGNIVLVHEPHSLCKACGEMVSIAYELREKADKSQLILDEMQPKIDVSLIKIEPDVTQPEEKDEEESDEDDGANEDNSEPKFDYPRHPDPDPDYNPFKSKCDLCKGLFKNETALKRHIIDAHPEEQPFECLYCKKRFFTERKLDNHQKNCSKRPKNTSEEKQHQKFVCPVCGILASIEHIKGHSLADKKPLASQCFICDICGTQASRRGSILNHMRVQHLNVLLQCKYCPLAFKNPSTLQGHMQHIHQDKTKKMKCRLCDFTSYRNAELRRHRLVHMGRRMPKCHICSAKFPSNCKLQEHLASHSDARPFTCDICGSAFKTKRAVNRHKKTHRAYDYECPVCQRGYLTNQLMRNHAEKNHPEYQLPPPGTIFSKSFLMKRAEQQLKDFASSKGVKMEELAPSEIPPFQYHQPFFRP